MSSIPKLKKINKLVEKYIDYKRKYKKLES